LPQRSRKENCAKSKLRKGTLERLRERRRLRNQIIHAYALAESDEEIYSQASDFDDVKSFISEAKRPAGK
jgi:uncharacterized protein YutE (UPF0331/DUF86 family)